MEGEYSFGISLLTIFETADCFNPIFAAISFCVCLPEAASLLISSSRSSLERFRRPISIPYPYPMGTHCIAYGYPMLVPVNFPEREPGTLW